MDEILKCDDSNKKLLRSTFLLCCGCNVVLTFKSVDEILPCKH